jgi:hypothetical protein
LICSQKKQFLTIMTDINDLMREILGHEISKAKSDETGFCPSKGLVQALKATNLSIFTPIADLGYFGWTPNGEYKELDEVTVADITESIDVDTKPSLIVPIERLMSKLPMTFESLSPRETTNKYPHKPPHVTSIHVAVRHRGVDMSKVDFFFGGSTLEILATRKISNDKEYLVTLLPGTDTIMIASHKEYISDKAAPGYQFERFMTGEGFGDKHKAEEIVHMQLMDVGGHVVLFNAEVDAMDDNDDPVEVTTGNPRYWGTSKVYQMISSGTHTLYAGNKYRGSLTQVVEHRLPGLITSGFAVVEVMQHECNIKDAMASLLEELEAGKFEGGKRVFSIRFDGMDIVLEPWSAENVFVPGAVMRELIL